MSHFSYTPLMLDVVGVGANSMGDFRGGFITALLRGDPPKGILRFANAAAAISCSRLGAMNGVPSLEETESLLSMLLHR